MIDLEVFEENEHLEVSRPKIIGNFAKLKNGIEEIESQKGVSGGIAMLDENGNVVEVANKAVADVDGRNIVNTYAPLHNPVFTGVPLVPTAVQGTNNGQVASTAFVANSISSLVDSSPDALNTLQELAAALGNDPNFATTIATEIGKKFDSSNVVSEAIPNKVLVLNVEGKFDADITGTAAKAICDGVGNNITDTYLEKTATSVDSEKLGGMLPASYVTQDEDGNVTIAGDFTAARVWNAYYNDYAEFFERGCETEAGDVIALDENSNVEQYVKATDRSKCVVGVQSDEFGHIIGGETDKDGNFDYERNMAKYIPVALCGRVHVKFYGKARVGMRVVPSTISGVARAYENGDLETSVLGTICRADEFENVRLVKIIVRRY